ncbi:hypothetical protein M426DRAFT_18647 [Hypoxylon sp. CI-4A]|nr:hypothetical protein M426DRAFT_18647 [Hypoxylon sp. CI-4A]
MSYLKVLLTTLPFIAPSVAIDAHGYSRTEDATTTTSIHIADKSSTVPYTSRNGSIPAVVAFGTPPLANGLPALATDLTDLPCVLDPRNNADQFNILGSNFQPLIVQADNNLQPLPAPKSEIEANAMGHPDDLALPTFFFQKPANILTEIYDIVLLGETLKYVAKTSQGGLVLTSSSTGPTAVERDDQTIVTSIFGVDCKGKLSVTENGSPFTWDISADGASTTFTPGIATSNRSMVAYSLRMKDASRRSIRAGTKYNSGAAPRCPKIPDDLVARPVPGVREAAFNGCGPSNGADFVPDFGFRQVRSPFLSTITRF